MLDFTQLAPRTTTYENFYDIQEACSTLYSFIMNNTNILPTLQYSVINSIQTAIVYQPHDENTLYYLYDQLHNCLYYNAINIAHIISPPPQPQQYVPALHQEQPYQYAIAEEPNNTNTVIRVTKHHTKKEYIPLRRSPRLAAKENIYELA